jgi:hypothetical protein
MEYTNVVNIKPFYQKQNKFYKNNHIPCFIFNQKGKVLCWSGILKETVFLDLFLFLFKIIKRIMNSKLSKLPKMNCTPIVRQRNP